jgi:hypothetical protein
VVRLSATTSPITSQPGETSKTWLFGPLPDLLFGSGLLFLCITIVFGVAGPRFFESVPLAIPALLIAFVSAPHYGATLLRVYNRRSDRRAYFLFSVVATGALLSVAGLSLTRPLIGSVLATIYLSWSSWHYTGQNYGISLIFLRRRSVQIDSLPQRILQASFVISFLLVFLVIHEPSGQLADPSVEIRLIPLGIPLALNTWLLPGLLFVYGTLTVSWIIMFARRCKRFSDLAPTILISVVQALWWSVPYFGKHFGLESDWVAIRWDDRQHFFPWIAGAHAAQYLWITSFYSRTSGTWRSRWTYYVAALTAGSAVWALPALLLAPAAGEFDWNFILLLGATVNIHHFILDGVIWKLRHAKIARVLILNEKTEKKRQQGREWLRGLVWAIATAGLVISLHGLVERHVIEPVARARNDLVAVASSLDRQAWYGQGAARARFELGRSFERAGNNVAAARQFELSSGMEPRVESLKRLVALYYNAGNRNRFINACERLFDLDHVQRPVPALDPLSGTRAQLLRFQDTCIEVARAARPRALASSDPTGGGGQDGAVPRRPGR